MPPPLFVAEDSFELQTKNPQFLEDRFDRAKPHARDPRLHGELRLRGAALPGGQAPGGGGHAACAGAGRG